MGETTQQIVVKDIEIEVGNNQKTNESETTIQKELQLKKQRQWRTLLCFLTIILIALIATCAATFVNKLK
ncbi:hypothetical protein DDB_G0287903 [Dictyostelium discoideum AX4]|uniref:Transmembrane protein n=1 Tax=Dictyostelium discoideum TaxID=44689 RepID=Q54JP9_DICDI|nr:hypothetical protein DDB_G0287903 [Dictyostelium discoideum AX4]EAL63598.1 hypothetical protein DDB_G0287903 [Dictyostelium discoideum AX4]|eukprot:XP_637103.1 hypothetical protein DDB_G0287903 [Dictyostelium discoideum AX4]